MQVIPVQAIANQTLTCQLGNQSVLINLYQKATGLFADVLLNGVIVKSGVLCLNGVKWIRDLYLGFSGDLVFFDQSGAGQDPTYTGLGSQFVLYYYTPTDLGPGIG